MTELKPCPFCGGKVTMVYNSMDNAFKVYHSSSFDAMDCPVIEPIMLGDLEIMSLKGAREAWNRRANDG